MVSSIIDTVGIGRDGIEKVKVSISTTLDNNDTIPVYALIHHMDNSRQVVISFSFNENSPIGHASYTVPLTDMNCTDRVCKTICDIFAMHGVITNNISPETFNKYITDWVNREFPDTEILQIDDTHPNALVYSTDKAWVNLQICDYKEGIESWQIMCTMGYVASTNPIGREIRTERVSRLFYTNGNSNHINLISEDIYNYLVSQIPLEFHLNKEYTTSIPKKDAIINFIKKYIGNQWTHWYKL